ncbi:MAG: SUMF1/EgtB/PvdO family nonheme iron enzyme [Candidatus Kapaibacterium sp.]
MKKYIEYFALILFTVFFYSCGDDDPNAPMPLELYSVKPEATWVGDTITIYGTGMGFPSDSSMIWFDTNRAVSSYDCINWTVSRIDFVVPEWLDSIEGFSVVAYGDTSNSLSLEVYPLPPIETVELTGGTFRMGSETGFNDESPVHDVTVRPFIISTYEINQYLYEFITGENPSLQKDPFLPVHNVTWQKAVEFCNLLSEIHELTPAYEITGHSITLIDSAEGWRLPTEAEWEYACRAGTYTDFSGSDEPGGLAWYDKNSGMNVQFPGGKEANAFGLYDIHGNVWEWCWDFYDPDYYENSPENNPLGADTGARHVARGGSYATGKAYLRCANRKTPDDFIKNTGIRIVRNK